MNNKINNMPGFAAEASLYKTIGNYQTGRHTITPPRQLTSPIYLAMVNTGGIHCGNCVGGECAELHCFENWTHGGGGPGGPYPGDGGGWRGGVTTGPVRQMREHTFCCGERCVSKLCPADCISPDYSCGHAPSWRPTIACCGY